MDDAVDYCRQIEAYLCRKNGGHLVRIVGPAFETVCGWAAQGIPLKIAFRGIDRRCERAHARGGRRRPMRIEFCEADVLEAFDDWRRALGVATHVSEAAAGDASDPAARRGSLASHIERSVTRLLAVKGSPDPDFDDAVVRVTGELDELAANARKARGGARERTIARLAELDAELLAAARHRIEPSAATALQREADAELASFSSRMTAESLSRARELAFARLLRETYNLPVLTYE